MLQNVADLKDPNDKDGRTYREVNNEKDHRINVGTLVELHHGERLFVVKQTRDCDGTPLYNLGVHGCGNTVNGFTEDCLKVIVQK